MKVDVMIANESHLDYAEKVCELIYISAQERGTGIAKRTPEYIKEKIRDGKAVIAIAEDGSLAGYSYIETWGHTKFVANSGLIVAHEHRKTGLARRIKHKTFELSRMMFPYAKIFSITTGLAVMKINTEMGFKPVTFSELTDDKEFWAGCEGCKNFDILVRNDHKLCLCTGLLYDPKWEIEKKKEEESKENTSLIAKVGKGIAKPFKAMGKKLKG
jgi:hypothetical protein